MPQDALARDRGVLDRRQEFRSYRRPVGNECLADLAEVARFSFQARAQTATPLGTVTHSLRRSRPDPCITSIAGTPAFGILKRGQPLKDLAWKRAIEGHKTLAREPRTDVADPFC